MRHRTQFKLVTVFSALLIVMLMLAACGGKTQLARPAQKVRVGVIMPFTGPMATTGINSKTGMEIAIEELGANSQIELVFEDSQFSPRVTVTAYNKFVHQDGIRFIIGATNSSATLAMAPLAAKDAVLLVTPASGSSEISKAGEYVFRTATSTRLEAFEMALFILKQGWKRIAIYYLNNDYGVSFLADLKKELTGEVEIVATEAANTNEQDFKTSFLKIGRLNIDGIATAITHVAAANFYRDRLEMNIKTPIVSSRVVEKPELITAAGEEAVEGVYVISSTPYVRPDLIEKLREKYPEESFPTLEFAGGYDAVKAISWVVEQCGPDPVCAKDKLLQIDYAEGAMGPLRFDEKGDAIYKIAAKIFRNGRSILYEN